jgi:hypothetical protein
MHHALVQHGRTSVMESRVERPGRVPRDRRLHAGAIAERLFVTPATVDV